MSKKSSFSLYEVPRNEFFYKKHTHTKTKKKRFSMQLYIVFVYTLSILRTLLLIVYVRIRESKTGNWRCVSYYNVTDLSNLIWGKKTWRNFESTPEKLFRLGPSIESPKNYSKIQNRPKTVSTTRYKKSTYNTCTLLYNELPDDIKQIKSVPQI